MKLERKPGTPVILDLTTQTTMDSIIWALMRLSLAIILLLTSLLAHTLESVSLQAEILSAQDWKLEGITLKLSNIAAQQKKLTLAIKKLTLPKPFDDLQFVSIDCVTFTWQNKTLICQHGKAKIQSQHWLSPEMKFSFQFREHHNTLQLSDLKLAGGSFTLDAEERGQQWAVKIQARKVDSASIGKLLQFKGFMMKTGVIDFNLKASGSLKQIQKIKLDSKFNELTIQTPSGRFATENLTWANQLEARQQNGLWQWQNQTQLKGGALYFEPVYLEVTKPIINWQAQGVWNPVKHQVDLCSFRYQHGQAANISGQASIALKPAPILENAAIMLHSQDLKTLSELYWQPFFVQTSLEGIHLAGELTANLSLAQQALNSFAASFKRLAIQDDRGRLQLKNSQGEIVWANDDSFNTPSQFGWQQLSLRGLPLGPAQLTFLSRAKAIKLLKPSKLPFLAGTLDIDQFNWQAQANGEPAITFQGRLQDASLAQLSAALNWTPLSGTISGVIPKVDYRDKTLHLEGQLILTAFDGRLTIRNLASSGLFSDFPKLKADLDIDNLDLEQLTGKFSFGSISGRLSGFVRQLSLENWQPVSFYAWFGTPEDDDSSHRISQKAVKNIANIGGGGASDLLSRSFLRFFETFGYDRLGFGCYLHDAVCQLMGVESTSTGYAIITGGGLPRIDVIGYNPQVDWQVLVERLKRVTTSDEVIIK